MHNSLRRTISDLKSRGGATIDPMLADTLLDRALTALGGPVVDSRPPQETVNSNMNTLQQPAQADEVEHAPGLTEHAVVTDAIDEDLGLTEDVHAG